MTIPTPSVARARLVAALVSVVVFLPLVYAVDVSLSVLIMVAK